MIALPSGHFVVPIRAVDDLDLGHVAFRILAALSTYQSKDGWISVSVATIAKRVGQAHQVVGRQINALEELGYIDVQHEKGRNGACQGKCYRLIYGTAKTPTAGGE